MRLFPSLSLSNRFFQLAILATLLITVAWFFLPSSFDVIDHIRVPAFSRPPAGTTPIDTSSPPVETAPIDISSPPAETPPIDASTPTAASDDSSSLKTAEPNSFPPRPDHPIDDLIQNAEEEFVALMSKQVDSLANAAQAYRARRGRQPPPGFDQWYAFATEQSALVIEDLFDRIYDDLNPFWGVPAKQIREQANDFFYRVSVRQGNVSRKSDEVDRPWMGLWEDMVRSVAAYLPDVDLPINVMDESRVVVPWEEINGFMEIERANRTIVPAEELRTSFQSLEDLDKHPPEAFDPAFDNVGPYWPLAVVGCPPESPARKAYIETDFSSPPPLTGQYPLESYHGYVKNWTFASSPCDHPALQGLHGTFVEPISLSTTRKLMPLFGGSKLPVNNDILLPPAMYWTDDPFYSGGEDHGAEWSQKQPVLMWRGKASGGRNKEENWTRFQRHRFVAMVNATNVGVAASHPEEQPLNFVLPANDTYDLAARRPGSAPADFETWVDTWSDAAIVDLACFPNDNESIKNCTYTDPYFVVAESLPMQAQYADKYLADLDGNSFSGRYRGFLGSTSLPIKATIYREWHDSRLIPWKHFVPMDNTFIDIYGIMEYFVGNSDKEVGGHDKVAEDIARSGKEWAETVLRKEDMSVYVLRLLLEYARLCDDERETMGWAG